MAVTKELYLEYAESLAKRNMYFDWGYGGQEKYWRQYDVGHLFGNGKDVYELVGYYSDEEDTKLFGEKMWQWMDVGADYRTTGQRALIDLDDPYKLIYDPNWNPDDYK